jgi:hypothetical protein
MSLRLSRLATAFPKVATLETPLLFDPSAETLGLGSGDSF